jgi:hypothetical protein
MEFMEEDSGKKRLTPQDRSRDLLPFRRAEEVQRCFLYWAPAGPFPIPAGQRQWWLQFLDKLAETAGGRLGLRAETFLQVKPASEEPLSRALLANMEEFVPLTGLSRRPGTKPPEPDLQQDVADLQAGRKKYNVNDYVTDFCYWFVDKSGAKQREALFGHGAMNLLFLKPDPKTQPPEIPKIRAVRESAAFQGVDLDRMASQAYSLKDGWLAKSRELLGADLANHPHYRRIPFVVPLLSTQDFFSQTEEEVKKWFEIFDIYLGESPMDKGIVMASSVDFEKDLRELLHQMKEQGLKYPG